MITKFFSPPDELSSSLAELLHGIPSTLIIVEPPSTWFLDNSSACQLALYNSRGRVLQVLLVVSKIEHNSPPNSIQGKSKLVTI